MSRDIPIIFSAPMVLALLAGHKTMTRRLAQVVRKTRNPAIGERQTYSATSPWCDVKPGDNLWVRESVQAVVDDDFDAVKYLADGKVQRSTADTQAEADRYQDQLFCYRGRKNAPDIRTGVAVPSIHMPRWASRITLVVTSVKLELLQNIRAADSIAEGVACETCVAMGNLACDGLGCFASITAFRDLWTSLHGAMSWQSNPDVVALSFRVICANIDSAEAGAA